MKKSLILLSILLAVGLSSCGLYFPQVTGSGTIISEAMYVGNFTKVVVGSEFKATVEYGDTAMIEITADDNLIEGYVGVFMKDDTVTVTLDPFSWYSGITVEAKITLPLLEGATAKDNSEVTVLLSSIGFLASDAELNSADNATLTAAVSTTDLTVNAAGNSNLTMSFIGTVSNLTATVEDNAKVKQTGTLTSAYITASGNSKTELESPTINRLDVELSDNSELHVNDVNHAYGTLEDNAKLYYDDMPTWNLRVEDNANLIDDNFWF